MQVKKNIIGINLILILVILFGITNLVTANAQLESNIQPPPVIETEVPLLDNAIISPQINAADLTPEQRRARIVELEGNLITYRNRLEQIETELRNLRAVNPQTPEILRLIGIYEGYKVQLNGQIAAAEAELAALRAMMD